VRRHGHFDACEDAVQEALVDAFTQWRATAPPDNPRAWLLTVATRRLMDQWRSDTARERREATFVAQTDVTSSPDSDQAAEHDDSLAVLFLCCHPSLTPAAQVALTLRAVGGLTTAEVARAFLVPEATMAPTISRAKQRIRAAGARFAMPDATDFDDRLRVVLRVLYLIFNEGYTASSGPHLQRVELADEAIRLTRQVRTLLPGDGEVAGLLALMLLTNARRAARAGPNGALIPIAEQDRGLWDRSAVDEGVTLISDALTRAPLGPFQLQAAIAAVHAEAVSSEDTDWPQIAGLYELLEHFAPSPVVTLNRAVAVAMVSGPDAGLALLDTIESDKRLARNHRLDAVRGHLLEMAGDRMAAREHYQRAARRTTSIPEQRYLTGRAARLAPAGGTATDG
jgi:RNA polymerase sigma factor (sigma-70 family)